MFQLNRPVIQFLIGAILGFIVGGGISALWLDAYLAGRNDAALDQLEEELGNRI